MFRLTGHQTVKMSKLLQCTFTLHSSMIGKENGCMSLVNVGILHLSTD